MKKLLTVWEERFWLVLLGFTAVVIVVASALWIHDHPYAVQWDEASYFNLSVLNLGRLHSGNLRQTVGVILGSGDSSRPPAYRILVLPFLWLFGPNLAAARLLSLLLSGASAGFLYAATCRVAGRAAGAFALLIFLLSPEVVAASIFFSTEAPFLPGHGGDAVFPFRALERRKRNTGSMDWPRTGCRARVLVEDFFHHDRRPASPFCPYR